ncbi:MAG: restriction endonuclease subunit S [Saprospirales bacterium]|nr:restriction endonuclease subunit S [Saprospirales bacterium]
MREGWKTDRLESVITKFIVPQRDRPKVFDGDVPWCRIEDFDGVYLSKSKSGLCVSQEVIDSMPLRVYPKGTVIVSCSADLGRCAIVAVPLITNQTFIGLVPSEDIDSLYLYYLMGSKATELNAMASGATIKYLSKKKFQELQIPIPPLPEQKQIVSILDQAFAAIDQAKANMEKNIANAKELFQSKLNEIFSQKGEGWEEKTFGELSTRIGDGLHGTPQYDENGDYYFINGNNLNNGIIEIKEGTKQINQEEYLKHRKELNSNTVLVSINGTLGNVAFYNDEPIILGKSACYINFMEIVYKHYIKYLIKSPLFFKNMADESTGATIKISP